MPHPRSKTTPYCGSARSKSAATLSKYLTIASSVGRARASATPTPPNSAVDQSSTPSPCSLPLLLAPVAHPHPRQGPLCKPSGPMPLSMLGPQLFLTRCAFNNELVLRGYMWEHDKVATRLGAARQGLEGAPRVWPKWFLPDSYGEDMNGPRRLEFFL